MQLIRISSTPRAFKSVNTPNQNFAPSLSEIYTPISSLYPLLFMANNCTLHGLQRVPHALPCNALHQAIQKDKTHPRPDSAIP